MVTLLMIGFSIGVASLNASCSSSPDAFVGGGDASQLSARAHEGDDPGECSDGADNDNNGFFDCEDQGCWNSPACKGQRSPQTPADTSVIAPPDATTTSDSSGTPSDADTSVPTPDAATTTPDLSSPTDGTSSTNDVADVGPGKVNALSQLTSVAIIYTQAVDFQGQFEQANCASYGICDCTNVFYGSGTQFAVASDRVTFQGVWKLQSSDCHAELQKGLTWVDESGSGYHTVVFTQGVTAVDAWIAHFKATATSPLPSPKQNQQWYIFQMNAPFNGQTLSVDHTEGETDYSDPLAPAKYTHTLQIRFNQ